MKRRNGIKLRCGYVHSVVLIGLKVNMEVTTGVQVVRPSIEPCKTKICVRHSYFYNPKTHNFSETCLPSQLNPVKQRKRERENAAFMHMAQERIQELPSYVRMKDTCNIGSSEVCEF